jgi:hypothetical protein
MRIFRESGYTWAESAKRTKALASDLQQRLAAANRQWIADLAAHKFDTGQRSAASAALLTWPTQQNMDNAMVSR